MLASVRSRRLNSPTMRLSRMTYARSQTATISCSSELPEVVAVCDRAYVMRDKTIVGELSRTELTEENILRMAMRHG